MLRLAMASAMGLMLAASASCNHERATQQRPETGQAALEQAEHFFGAGQAVSQSGIAIPKGAIFIAVPNPVPPDYDGYQAVLVSDAGGRLQGREAVRFVWNSGVRDPDLLSHVAAVFVGESLQLVHDEDRGRAFIRGHGAIENPVLASGQLVFFVVRGSMLPTAYRVTLDLTSFEATARPASEVARPAASP
jgi:hypothetical protein